MAGTAAIDSYDHELTAGNRIEFKWIALFALAHLPFVWMHIRNLWSFRPHYEFAPFVMIAAAVLIWKRWPHEQCEHSQFTRVLSWGLLASGVATMLVAVFMFSPLLGTVATILDAGGVILLLTGRNAWRALLPVWLLFWLVVPPPRQLDNELIRFQQSSTSEISHDVLNLFGILHQRSGNVFRIPDRELFVAEAYSGVNSQLVLLAVGALLCVIEKRAWLHSILLLGSAFLWSVLANSARVTLVVYAAAEWGTDLATGWQHDALGYSLIFVGFIGLLSTDQFLIGILAPLPILQTKSSDPAGMDENVGVMSRDLVIDTGVYRFWNRFIARRDKPIPRYVPEPEPNAVPEPKGTFRPASSQGLVAATVVLLVLAVMQSGLAMMTRPDVKIEGIGLEELMGEESMPVSFQGWGRVDYQLEQRDRLSQEGEYTHLWTYRKGIDSIMLSMDFPFIGWHDLPSCYVGRGWRQEEIVVEGDRGDEFWVVELSKVTGERGLLIYSLHESDGNSVLPDEQGPSISRKLLRSPVLQVIKGDRGVNISNKTTQFQTFQTFPGDIDDLEKTLGIEFFKKARKEWKQTWLKTLEEQSGE